MAHGNGKVRGRLPNYQQRKGAVSRASTHMPCWGGGGQPACPPEGLPVMIHDNSEVCGRLMDFQQAQHCRQEAIADGGVFSARCLKPLCPEAIV